jgi:AhpC/TSA family
LPALIEFYEKHADQRDDFEILAFHDGTVKSFAELDPKLEPLIKDPWKGKSLPFPILLDASGQTIKDWGVHAFPTTVLIDPDGHLVEGGGEEMLKDRLAEMKKARDGD